MDFDRRVYWNFFFRGNLIRHGLIPICGGINHCVVMAFQSLESAELLGPSNSSTSSYGVALDCLFVGSALLRHCRIISLVNPMEVAVGKPPESDGREGARRMRVTAERVAAV